MTITITISEQDSRLLNSSIVGYRSANADMDNAIESENWCAINTAQDNRSLHANTIALIINKHTDAVAEQGARA
jgi:hypothetical protein